MSRILVRRPSPRLADGELTHLNRRPVDPHLALEQWRGYVAAFADRGWEVTEVAPADEHPDGVFVEDTVLMSADAPGSAELFESRGLSVVRVPITEFEKLEGCVTCLSVRIRG
jgi:N-dimethylarginine dimethylaminohydrolase